MPTIENCCYQCTPISGFTNAPVLGGGWQAQHTLLRKMDLTARTNLEIVTFLAFIVASWVYNMNVSGASEYK
jgi:hypothetical protein